MIAKRFEPGTIVVSKAGRDAGRPFVVLEWDGGNWVWLADGDLRKVQKPKKKKVLHLRVTSHRLDYTPDMREDKAGTLDARIRKDLQLLGYHQQAQAFEEKKEG